MEGSSSPPLTSASSVNLAGSAVPGHDNNSNPERKGGDWFEIVHGDNNPAIVSSAGAAAGRESMAAATTAAAPVEDQRVPAFNFSFAMGGWLMFYSFGVAKCLLDHGLHKVRPLQQSFIGSSAGSLAATALALEADIDKARSSAPFAWKQNAVCAMKPVSPPSHIQTVRITTYNHDTPESVYSRDTRVTARSHILGLARWLSVNTTTLNALICVCWFHLAGLLRRYDNLTGEGKPSAAPRPPACLADEVTSTRTSSAPLRNELHDCCRHDNK